MIPQEVCVLIPGYNEAKNIPRVISAVRSRGFSVLVIDDGSGDDMAVQARHAGAEVLSYTPNQGKGVALRRGMEYFLEKTSYRAVIFMDADGQHDPADLDVFLKALDAPAADVVIGNRMQDPKGMSRVRRFTNKFMSAILSLAARQRVPDTQCGYRAIRREALSRLKLQTAHFEIESEIILEAARAGCGILSVPVRSVYEGGASHIHPARDTARFFKFLFEYLARRR